MKFAQFQMNSAVLNSAGTCPITNSLQVLNEFGNAQFGNNRRWYVSNSLGINCKSKGKMGSCLFKALKPRQYDSIHESIGSYKFRQLCFFKSSLRNQFQFGSYKFRQWYFFKSSLRNQFQFACE